MPAVASDSIAVPIKAGGRIEADLWVPNLATGLVIFAYGTGSSRFSSRNRTVAHTLPGAQPRTALLDARTGRTARW